MRASPREQWRAWYRLKRVAAREGSGRGKWLQSIGHAVAVLRPDWCTGRTRYPTPMPNLSAAHNVRWLYRCVRYGRMRVPEAKRRVIAAGLYRNPPLSTVNSQPCVKGGTDARV